MHALLAFLGRQPFELLFMVVAAGYLLGTVKLKGINLGATAATLLIALAVSLLASGAYGVNFQLPEFASTLAFNLFMFAIGVKVGPQFISGLKRDARNFIILAVLVPVLCLLIAVGMDVLLKLPPGTGPGILAGATTATPAFGAAQSAFSSGAAKVPAGTSPATSLGNLSTAFAFAYVVSMVLFTVVMKILPKVFHLDVVKEAKAYGAKMQGRSSAPLPGTTAEFDSVSDRLFRMRALRVENEALSGRSLKELQREHPEASIEGVMRDGAMLSITPDTVLQRGDVVALHADLPTLLAAEQRLGPEVNAPTLTDLRVETVDVVAHMPDAIGKPLGELTTSVGYGLFLNAMFRGGEFLPSGPDTVLQRGDVLRVTGTPARIARLAQHSGGVIRPRLDTDIVTLAIGLTLGGFLGAIVVPIGAIKFSLGSAVGLLLVGIALSIIRTRRPGFGGPFPEPARQLVEDLGLNVFIAITGLNSGMGVVKAIQAGTLGPILGGAVVIGLVPAVIAWALGQYRLKMNGAILMGAVAGARCNSAGMRAAQEATKSTVPALAYPVTFAASNILLTLFCYLMPMFV